MNIIVTNKRNSMTTRPFHTQLRLNETVMTNLKFIAFPVINSGLGLAEVSLLNSPTRLNR